MATTQPADLLRKYASMLPPRTERSNKGTYGTLLMAAGSRGMAGAAVLGALSACRMGTGIVMVLSDADNRTILQSAVPEAIFREYQDSLKPGGSFAAALRRAGALAAGPGIGMSEDSASVMKRLLLEAYEDRSANALEGRPLPLVIDADGLNLLADDRYAIPETARQTGVIITPHPGEMSRLTGLTVSRILEEPERIAKEYAREHGLICLLKDHRTVITDGEKVFRNPTGCDGMATAGSGDVLTGMIGGLLAQGCGPLRSARLGAFVHGLAGELAEKELGARSVMARDIIAHIPEALQFLERADREKAGSGFS